MSTIYEGRNMKKIKEFLKYDYRKKILNVPKDCPSLKEICDYASGLLPLEKKKAIESHLAGCYHCLDMVTSIHDGIKFYNPKRRYKMKKEDLFLIMAIISFLLSFIFSRYFLQFLTATIIFGIKWIVDSKSSKTLIMIYEAWKRGGEREAGRILREIETKERIDSKKFS